MYLKHLAPFYTKQLINEFVSPVVFGFSIWARPQPVCGVAQEVINNGHA